MVTAVIGLAVLATAASCGEAKIRYPTKADLVSDATIDIAPTAKREDVPVSAEIKPGIANGKLVTLKLTKRGEPVEGELRPDGTSWVSAKPLSYDTKYTATVTAIDDHRRTVTAKSAFTTMDKPARTIEPYLANEDGKTYGKAMPVALDFPDGFEVPEKKRAAVEKRLFVSSAPEQAGVWHWFSGGRLQYRPKDYWRPGTEVSVRLGLKGLKLGKGVYGAKDLKSDFNIDDTDRELLVSNKKKHMIAKKDGKRVKTIAVALGKPGYESYSGTMAIMERLPNTTFDTTREPGCNGKEDGVDCYRTNVDHAERLTWTGQFIHSAPWSVWAQGNTNVSHGCVNVSPGDASWIYEFVRVGDPVTVKGTGVALTGGDGYTAYDLSWDEFRAGSYLEQPAALGGVGAEAPHLALQVAGDVVAGTVVLLGQRTHDPGTGGDGPVVVGVGVGDGHVDRVVVLGGFGERLVGLAEHDDAAAVAKLGVDDLAGLVLVNGLLGEPERLDQPVDGRAGVVVLQYRVDHALAVVHRSS
ncbi:ErfK/YbiS/YcfS/YnhG family protein [Stackebrandtia nassauensis DSM 44728]|uniref:ErfK/YbiS/YcfS/YnhG family protein n=1 Tax=Stackebrandtia nassauensis (strain DSM 44728 / CIP 108903 / NRRL B-16338 / NBRC 102104 / LLR-40K-21) TaxID=446470 RepID=D3QC01_STANL|nr:ErfK/YbiS/YcfS/YnhG family protein [Stackebrandtia nassauensis DSM 44728]